MAPIRTVRVVHKVGPDCGVLAASLHGNGAGAGGDPLIAAVEVDTYDEEAQWNHVTELVLSPAVAEDVMGATLLLQLNSTGAKNPRASNAYVQIVGVMVDVQL